MSLKMYCIVSKEALKKMNGVRGKLGAMTGHGFLHSFWDAENRFPEAAEAYRFSGKAFKIVLSCEADDELLTLATAYASVCGVSLVEDDGTTVFGGEKTVTCVGIGPLTAEQVGDDLKALRVLT